GRELEVDDHQPQVFADKARFQEHPIRYPAGNLDGALDLVEVSEPDGNAAALLAPRRLHDHAAVAREEGFDVAGRAVGVDLLRYLHARLAHQPRRDRLVVADGDGDAGSQFAQTLAAMDGPAAEREAEDPAPPVGDGDTDAAAPGLFDDDARIWIER